jgi:hypothetical protein
MLTAAHSGALRTRDLARVTVDTTVQPKAITFPTNAKLLHAAIQGLNRLAKKHGVRLRRRNLGRPMDRRRLIATEFGPLRHQAARLARSSANAALPARVASDIVSKK